MSEDTTLRGLLRGLCVDLLRGFRREVAALTANMDRDISARERELAQLEAMATADDDGAEVAGEEYESFHLMQYSKTFATTVHDTLADLAAEFKQVS